MESQLKQISFTAYLVSLCGVLVSNCTVVGLKNISSPVFKPQAKCNPENKYYLECMY